MSLTGNKGEADKREEAVKLAIEAMRAMPNIINSGGTRRDGALAAKEVTALADGLLAYINDPQKKD
ncbi:MAG: hypothetical protein A2001_01605 [Treponema sp. GWC1_61_84]|nr:MAG: hypothetical protein A2001_01605 [Treponema sp. GWC1_61_84]